MSAGQAVTVERSDGSFETWSVLGFVGGHRGKVAVGSPDGTKRKEYPADRLVQLQVEHPPEQVRPDEPFMQRQEVVCQKSGGEYDTGEVLGYTEDGLIGVRNSEGETKNYDRTVLSDLQPRFVSGQEVLYVPKPGDIEWWKVAEQATNGQVTITWSRGREQEPRKLMVDAATLKAMQ